MQYGHDQGTHRTTEDPGAYRQSDIYSNEDIEQTPVQQIDFNRFESDEKERNNRVLNV